MRQIIVNDNTFNVGCIFYINCGVEKMKRAVEKRTKLNNLDIGNNKGDAEFFCVQDKETTLRVIWLEKLEQNNVDIARLVHEIVHLVHSIVDWLGIDKSDDEFEAYMVEFYVKEFLKKYKKGLK